MTVNRWDQLYRLRPLALALGELKSAQQGIWSILDRRLLVNLCALKPMRANAHLRQTSELHKHMTYPAERIHTAIGVFNAIFSRGALIRSLSSARYHGTDRGSHPYPSLHPFIHDML